MTDLLFDIPTNPKPSNLEAQRVRREIARLKKEHGIWTHKAQHIEKEDRPWSALLFSDDVRKHYNEAYDEKFGPEDHMGLIAGYCRLLDEQRLLVTGETERAAIKELCDENDIENNL